MCNILTQYTRVVFSAGIVFCQSEEFTNVDYVVLQRAGERRDLTAIILTTPPVQSSSIVGGNVLSRMQPRPQTSVNTRLSLPSSSRLCRILTRESGETKKVAWPRLQSRCSHVPTWGGHQQWLHKTEPVRLPSNKTRHGFILSRLTWNQREQKIYKSRANCILTSEPGNLL